jgi:hypothetical protein
VKQESLASVFRTITGFLASLLLVGCAPPSGAMSKSGAALGATNEPDPAVATDEESSSRTPRIVTSVEYESVGWTYESRAGSHDGLQLTTPNYVIYTTKTTDSFIERLPLFYEAALANYTSALADLPYPKDRLQTYLFRDREQWMEKTREILPGQANTFRNLGRGGFTTRGTAVLFYIDYWRSQKHHDTLAIAAHEGWHQYTQGTFKDSLPVWLEEGVATYMEGFRARRGLTIFSPSENFERRSALRDAARKAKDDPANAPLISLELIVTRTPQAFLSAGKSDLLTYYAQVWALVRFLAEGEDGRYRDGLERVLLDAANGRLMSRLQSAAHKRGMAWRGPFSTAIVGRLVVTEYFNGDFTAFERQYLAFIDELTAYGRGD